MKKPSSKYFERAGQKERVCMILEIQKAPRLANADIKNAQTRPLNR
jgi:hypothetical protein